jgi:hypothetical protein
LAVDIGEHQVGILGKEATTAFTPVMDAAAERDELPYTAARLSSRPAAGYLLELQLPRMRPAVNHKRSEVRGIQHHVSLQRRAPRGGSRGRTVLLEHDSSAV